jgi:hypothetical protein
MAGAIQGVAAWLVEDWALLMRAEAAVGNVVRVGRVQQDAWLDIRGVGEDFRAAYGNFADFGNHFFGMSLRASC